MKREAPCIHCGSMKCRKETVMCLHDKMMRNFNDLWEILRKLEAELNLQADHVNIIRERVNAVRLSDLEASE